MCPRSWGQQQHSSRSALVVSQADTDFGLSKASAQREHQQHDHTANQAQVPVCVSMCVSVRPSVRVSGLYVCVSTCKNISFLSMIGKTNAVKSGNQTTCQSDVSECDSMSQEIHI